MNKDSGDDQIPVELFQILKDDAVKVMPSINQQIWETQQWPQDWKMSVLEIFQTHSKLSNWCQLTQYASKFGKFSSGHRTGKGQCSFQSLRKATPKNAQTTAQLYSSHMLVK